MGREVPVLLGEFEGDVLTVVVLLVEFSLQLLVDAFVLLAGEEEGRESQQGEAGEQPQLARAEES